MASQELWTKVNWLGRGEVIRILEGYLCIECNESESTDELRAVIVDNVESGDLDESVLEYNN